MILAKILDEATPNLRDVAKWTGLTYRNVRAYRLATKPGGRTPPPEALKKVAKAIRTHAAKLGRLADELEKTAEQDQ